MSTGQHNYCLFPTDEELRLASIPTSTKSEKVFEMTAEHLLKLQQNQMTCIKRLPN